jgi:hypothetical protein
VNEATKKGKNPERTMTEGMTNDWIVCPPLHSTVTDLPGAGAVVSE